MAGVGGRLGYLEAERPSGSDNSTSIPSGQGVPRIELLGSNDLPLTDIIRSTNTSDDKTDSQNHQPRATPQMAAVQGGEASRKSDGATRDHIDDKANEGEAMDLDIGNSSPPRLEESILDSVIPDSMPIVDLPPQQSEVMDSLPSLSSGEVPQAGPTSVTSISSGRQPPSKYDIGGVHGGRVEDSVLTTPPKIKTMDESEGSSSPFPTIEEIFHTAASSAASRQTQSSHKSTQASEEPIKVKVKPDLEYEEEMRKLDEGEGEDSDKSQDKNKSIRTLFPNATQPNASDDLPKLFTPEKATQIKRRLRTSPFVVPEGSQVVTIESSPQSVQFVEDYAYDSKDESYRESPPAAASLRLKKESVLNQRSTRGRGKKETEAGQLTRSRSSMPAPAPANTSAFSQIKKWRKRSGKF